MFTGFRILKSKGIRLYFGELEDITVRKKKYSLRQKQLITTVNTVLTLPLSEIPVGALSSYYNVAFVDKILKTRNIPSLNKLYRLIRESSRKQGLKSKAIVGVKGLKMLLSLMRGYGLLEVIYVENKYKIVLTALGRIVGRFISENIKAISKLPYPYRVLPALIPGILFPTKARLLYYVHSTTRRRALSEYYALIKSLLYNDRIHGYERIAYEVLEEIIAVNAGILKTYITQTQIIDNTIHSLLVEPGRDYIEYLLSKTTPLKYDIAGLRIESVEKKEIHKTLDRLVEKLIGELNKDKDKIQEEFFALYGLPRRA